MHPELPQPINFWVCTILLPLGQIQFSREVCLYLAKYKIASIQHIFEDFIQSENTFQKSCTSNFHHFVDLFSFLHSQIFVVFPERVKSQLIPCLSHKNEDDSKKVLHFYCQVQVNLLISLFNYICFVVCRLGVKIQNLKVEFKTEGTWHHFGH